MRPTPQPSCILHRARRGARAAAAALLALALGAPQARAISAIQGPTYPVSAFEIEYALDHPRHIPEADLLDLEVGLAGEPGVLTAPRPVDRTMRMRLSAPPQGMVFTADAILHINRHIVATFNRRGFNGVIVSVPDIEEGSGRDLRPAGVTSLRLRIWTGRITRLASFADGERFGGLSTEARTNHPAHAWIRERAPVQPGGVRAILDVRALEDYASALSRHPGRRVDAELSPGAHPGTTQVDLRIAENKPWRVWAEYSNTGTPDTTKNRQRFGFVHSQLTSRDDVLDLRYTTGDFDSVHAGYGSYEAPFSLALPRLRGRLGGFVSHYDASEVGFDSLGLQGDEWGTEAALVWQAYQRRELFLDLVAGGRYHRIRTEGGQFTGGDDGDVGFAVPRLALEGERSTLSSSLAFDAGIDVGITGAAESELRDLGNDQVEDRFVLLHWGALYAFFLEPLIDPAGWADPETPEDSTLAHEVALRFSGQYSFQRLVPNYQAIVGGLDTLRGARQAELAADNQLLGRAEYRLHLPRLFMPDATPTALPLLGGFRTRPAHVFGLPDWDFVVRLFSDVGYSFATDELATESKETLWSVGTGAELQVLRNLIVGVDVGHVLHGAGQTDAGDTRAHVLATVLY
jgi:hemolysin activation/secretion protein